MGYENRDYSQADEWQGPSRDDVPVTKWVVILSIIVFVLQALSISPTSRVSPIFDFLVLKADSIRYGQIWRLISFAFCYYPTDILGLVFGLFITWRFGTDIERMYGSSESLLYLLTMTATVGTVFTVISLLSGSQGQFPLSGGSTISLGLLALFATHFPRMEVFFLPMISVQLRWLVAIFALFTVYPAIMAFQMGNGIGAMAHASPAVSILFAVLYRRWHWNLSLFAESFHPEAWRRAWRSQQARQKLKVFHPTPENDKLEAKLDAILVKIHEQGSESLTAAERAILTQASERIKKRNLD